MMCRTRLVRALFLVVVFVTTPASAAELSPRAAQAFADYVKEARRAFLARVTAGDFGTADAPEGVAASDDGILDVPDGLIHHWRASAFVRGLSLRAVVDRSQAYNDYASIYESVTASSILARDGDKFHVQIRIRESAGGLSAVLQIRHVVLYSHLRDGLVVSTANSEEIRQVEHAGTDREKLLPPDTGSGYLWRGATFTAFVEQPGGVRIETESVGLSRSFPPMVGWIIEPIARRIGRKSVETSLGEFIAALR